MDKEVVKAWKAGLEEANRFVIEEKRNRSSKERFRILAMMQGDSICLRHKREDDLDFHLIWNRARRRWLAKWA